MQLGDIHHAVLLFVNCDFRFSGAQEVAGFLYIPISLLQNPIQSLLCYLLLLHFAVERRVVYTFFFEVGKFAFYRVELFKHCAVNRQALESVLQRIDMLPEVCEFLLLYLQLLFTFLKINLRQLHFLVAGFKKRHFLLDFSLNSQATLDVGTAELHLLGRLH